MTTTAYRLYVMQDKCGNRLYAVAESDDGALQEAYDAHEHVPNMLLSTPHMIDDDFNMHIDLDDEQGVRTLTAAEVCREWGVGYLGMVE